MPTTPEPALLIAVTGSPGEGRTTLLAALAAELSQRGQRVAGFLAPAQGRGGGEQRGADSYRLQILGEPGDHPWAEHDPALTPPYRFFPATRAHLEAWAARLKDEPAPDLLVIDEFGRFEADGGGLLPLWPALTAAAPRIVVVAVRAGYVSQIEARLGRRFDLWFAASHPDTPEKLRAACAEVGEWTQVGLWGGASGTIEMTLGSALHSMKVPLRGAALCALQAATLTFASARMNPPGRVAWVAYVSAGLKAFSPGGGRVRPMVAIALQGSLFSAAVQVLGWNFLSVALGGAAIGAWAALQGFLLQYLLLGDDLLAAYAKVVRWLADTWQITAPSMAVLLGIWAVFHALLAAGAALTAWRLRAPPQALRRILENESAPAAPSLWAGCPHPAPPQHRSLPQRVAREFARWHFWVPLVVVAAVLLAAGRPWESVAWLAVRFVAVGAVLFALLSLFQPAAFAARLRRWGWWGPATALSSAFARRRR